MNVKCKKSIYKVVLLKEYFLRFCVKAENCVGFGTALELREPIIPKAPANRPSAPDGPLKYTGILATSVTVSWNKPGSQDKMLSFVSVHYGLHYTY